jgi:hypothetical protein
LSCEGKGLHESHGIPEIGIPKWLWRAEGANVRRQNKHRVLGQRCLHGNIMFLLRKNKEAIVWHF